MMLREAIELNAIAAFICSCTIGQVHLLVHIYSQLEGISDHTITNNYHALIAYWLLSRIRFNPTMILIISIACKLPITPGTAML